MAKREKTSLSVDPDLIIEAKKRALRLRESDRPSDLVEQGLLMLLNSDAISPLIPSNVELPIYTPEEQEQIDALVWVLREGGEDAAGMIRAVLKQLANRRPPQSKATPEKRRKRA